MRKSEMYNLVVNEYKEYIKLVYEFRKDVSYLNQELLQYGIYEGTRRIYAAAYGTITDNKYKLINWENIRNTCIKNNWYTCGTNADYDYLRAITLKHSDIELDTKEGYILTIVADIYAHSNNSNYNSIYKIINELFKQAQKNNF